MGLIIGGVSASDLIMDGKSVSLYVGGNPPIKVWPNAVKITLGTGTEARDQFRAALTARGLDYATITEVPFKIEFVGSGSLEYMFRDCYALTTAPEMDTSNVTNMKDMFSECHALTHVPVMDTSRVTNMRGMFIGCGALTHVPALDTSQVTDISYMFRYCNALTTVPAMDTSSATDMMHMFYNCPSLTHVPDLNTSGVKSVRFMFYNCSSLTDGNVRLIGRNPEVDNAGMIQASGLTREPWYRVDGTPIEVVQITLGNSSQAQYALRDALTSRGLAYRNVTELPFDIELVGSGVTQAMFDGFTALKSAPMMNTSQVTKMERMFNNCKALTTVPAMDTSQVTSTYYMFYGCSALTSVPTMDTSQVTNAQFMFHGCSALTDDNVRLIGKNPNADTMNMIRSSGLTREPFYATDRLPNPPAPRVVTISKIKYTSQWDKNSVTGDSSLIQEWTSNDRARFAAYVTCNEPVYYGGSSMARDPGAVIPSGVDVEPYMRDVYTFTEVI